MKNTSTSFLLLSLGALLPLALAQTSPPPQKPAAVWSFEQLLGGDPNSKLVHEPTAGVHDPIAGFPTLADGVVGNALKLDGLSTRLTRPTDKAPVLGDAFSFEGWIALQEYPWNWAAIVNQERDHKEGWFFGISGEGRLGLHVGKDGKWIECNSKSQLPLLKWAHVAGSYDPTSGLKVFINGKLEGEIKTTGPITPANGVDVILGLSHTKTFPIRTEREYSASFKSPMFLDGLLDEVKIYNKALTDAEVAQAYAAVQPKVAQPLKFRVLPSGPEGPADFGAVQTRLRYAPEWERHWRVGEDCDILVRFDELPTKIIFWRGMNYGACYVSENRLWSGDQSLEVNSAKTGCYEHMADKKCEFSTAKIVENTDARVVVHARYASVGIDGKFLNPDPVTGWGLWSDEYFTIYPDGVTVRYVVAKNHNGGGQWQETIIFNQPGSRPDDTVDIKAFTVGNEKGESQTYSWENGPPLKWKDPASPERYFHNPPEPNIQMVNMRSNFKPYLIFEPGVKIEGFGIPPAKDYSMFPCWNHWPVAQLPNDGRQALISDRPSHFSLSSSRPVIHVDPEKACAMFLYGMTDQPIESLAPISRSWNSAPAATLAGAGFESQGFDKSQRAYIFTAKAPDSGPLEFSLEATHESPIHNTAFVVKNWGNRSAKLSMDGKAMPRGKDFRFGHNKTIEGTDLVVWVKISGEKKTSFKIESRKADDDQD
ncbi:LamG domain-containing protein [bacterium]|nr:LamG domain-containing protein [bacterium]